MKKRFLIPLLAALALTSKIESQPYDINSNSKDIQRRCTSSIDYQKCINSYSNNSDLTNTNAKTIKIYLFSITNLYGTVGSKADAHQWLNGPNIIPTNNYRQCQSLASKQEQYFNEVSTNLWGNYALFYKCFAGASEGYGNYKLYVTAQNIYSPERSGNTLYFGIPTYIIPMKGFNQCSVAKLQIDNLANQIKAKVNGIFSPDFYTKCIKSNI